jgi:hypothetical protein
VDSLRVPSVVVVVFVILIVGSLATPAAAYTAYLSGGFAVPPVSTYAQGMAVFELSSGGDVLMYRLVVNHIRDVTQVHIQLAGFGSQGPSVVSLYEGGAVAESTIGVSGTITSADLTGPLAGRPLSALINSIQQGVAYVNVGTRANPPGEVRGPIR